MVVPRVGGLVDETAAAAAYRLLAQASVHLGDRLTDVTLGTTPAELENIVMEWVGDVLLPLEEA